MFHQFGTPRKSTYKEVLLPPAKKSGITAVMKGKWSTATSNLMQQSETRGKINPSWILLDSQSTVNVFSNAALLVNICEAKHSLDIYCTAGESTTNIIGDLLGFGTVWLYEDSIANILSLSKVAEKFPVIFNSSDGQ
eukprot:15084132-Ditylum_brightwellii.AAC.1